MIEYYLDNIRLRPHFVFHENNDHQRRSLAVIATVTVFVHLALSVFPCQNLRQSLQKLFPIGITILPEVTIAQDIVQGRLAALEWEKLKLEVATLTIWYKERWLSPTLSAFMDMTREALSR
jgi:DNA-binding transcriptional LysR family regulator